jgi:hypothetical protein
MIRIIAKLFAFAVILSAFLNVAPLFATQPQPVTWISSTGSDTNACTAASPCATFDAAQNSLISGGQINCIDSPGPDDGGLGFTASLTIDCAGVYELNAAVPGSGAFALSGTNQVVKIRNLTISGAAGGYPAIKVTGGGTLILENCVFENFNASGAGPALDIEPTGPFNLVITNSRISNNAAGVLIQPGTGGSVTATFDGITIVGNTGGGLKTDTINGPINLVISNSTISKNGGNGMNAVGNSGGAGLQNMLTLKNDVIASNGSAGVQANGGNAAVLVNNTVLDTNAAGATSTVNNGRVQTYGNNSVVGPVGSGFNGTASLQ